MKDYRPTIDRSTIEGEAFGSLHNAFGVANIRAIYRADYRTGQPQTTSIYLPNNDKATCNARRYRILTPTAKQPEPRVRMTVVMSSYGKSLLDYDLGGGLAMKFAQAMLGRTIILKSYPIVLKRSFLSVTRLVECLSERLLTQGYTHPQRASVRGG